MISIEEIAEDIRKQEEVQLSKAFTKVISSLLMLYNIRPIIIEKQSEDSYIENNYLNRYIIRKEYGVTFDLDTTEHDKQVKEEIAQTLNVIINDTFMNNDMKILTIQRWLKEQTE